MPDRLQDCPQDGVCPPVCEPVFDRVVVSYLISGGTRVLWDLLPTFTDPGPLTFQLQAGNTSNPDAGDWEDVGVSVVDQYSAHDTDQRMFGKTNRTHYRVKLTTSLGTYYSAPTGAMGILDRRGWRIAREMVRQKLVGFRVGPGGQRGYLLKRRWTGKKCPICTDHQTGESRDPACPTCYGTGFECGYYYPQSCVWAELNPRASRLKIDSQMRGQVQDIVVPAKMIVTDLMSEDDVWVNEKTDDRYYIHTVSHDSEYKGVPISAVVELRLIAFTSIIYTIPVPDQLRLKGL